MFTLVYIKKQFNRPENLLPFLKANVGNSTLLQIDCVTPYRGTERELIFDACAYLSCIDPEIKVSYKTTQNISTEVNGIDNMVNFMVIQITVSRKVLKNA